MKNYNLKDYQNSVDTMNYAMATDLSAELEGTRVHHKLRGNGIIRRVVGHLDHGKYDFKADIVFASGSFQLPLAEFVGAGLLTMPEDKVNLVSQYKAVIDQAAQEKEEAKKAWYAQMLANEAARKQKEAEAKKAAKFKKKVERDEAKLDTLVENKTVIDHSLLSALGWLANNMTSIKAAMPDHLEPWFRKHFGDVPARVVDQSVRSASGWTSQWGLSLTITLSEKAKKNIPLPLQEFTNRNQAGLISDVQFVYTLIEDYGFKIGTKEEQDLDEIRSHIPAAGLAEFESGLTAA